MPIPFDDQPPKRQKPAPTPIDNAFARLLAAQEVEVMELRESRGDPPSAIAALNLIHRIRRGVKP